MSIVLRIPESRLESILLLSKMSNEAFKELFHEVAKIKPPPSLDDMERNFPLDLKLISNKDATEIIKTILTLYPALISNGKSVSTFVEDLIDALDHQSKDPLDSNHKDALRDHLNALLKIPSLSVKAKATSVFYENERTYIGSRLVSDVRPVFGLEDDSINGIVIVHTLKIKYLEQDNISKEIYFALDNKDVDMLIESLKREKSKAAKIQSLFEEKSIEILEMENK